MLLTKDKSLCEEHQKIIVSEENRRKHRAINIEHSLVRHYRLDGDIVRQEKCCDFLVLNDSKKRAYFIELKGTNTSDAVQQLESAVSRFKDEVNEYAIYLRIVGKNMRTHQINSTEKRKLEEKYHGKLLCKSGQMEEAI
ncbi:MAG: hypothetical protein LUC98_00895 [Lachnospiraceae bacterium]|nr:hypothetical protein [Lachnospiraceae bacterium]